MIIVKLQTQLQGSKRKEREDPEFPPSSKRICNESSPSHVNEQGFAASGPPYSIFPEHLDLGHSHPGIRALKAEALIALLE